MLGAPQRYAELIATRLSETRVLKAPIVVIMPNGIGVAGAHIRDGLLVPVEAADARALTNGIVVGAQARGDDLARIAMVAVRPIATAAGRSLPAFVPVRSAYVQPSPATTATRRHTARRDHRRRDGVAPGAHLHHIVLRGVAALRDVACRVGAPGGNEAMSDAARDHGSGRIRMFLNQTSSP